MWNLYTTAKTFSQRPSALVDIADPWLALQFDNAVALVGNTIESESNRQVNRGTAKDPKWEPAYTLSQLLDPEFRLPSPVKPKPVSAYDSLRSLTGRGGVKVYKVK